MRIGLVDMDTRELRAIKRPDFLRSMATLREMQQEWRRLRLPANAEGIAALHLAITFREIELYAAAGPFPHIYNVWDYARRERIEVGEWLARQAAEGEGQQ